MKQLLDGVDAKFAAAAKTYPVLSGRKVFLVNGAPTPGPGWS